MSTNQIFGPQDGPAPDFLRNTYDKSFQNLITTDYGELRPCFCKEVIPGDSIQIDPAVIVRSHPIVFPINTRIKFYCYFFYGRNRIFYKQFEDFIWGTKDGLVPPLLKLSSDRAKNMISTGSLGDNLGVPTTIASNSNTEFSLNFYQPSFYASGAEFQFNSDSVFAYYSGSDYRILPGVNSSRDEAAFTMALSDPLRSIPSDLSNITGRTALSLGSGSTMIDDSYRIAVLYDYQYKGTVLTTIRFFPVSGDVTSGVFTLDLSQIPLLYLKLALSASYDGSFRIGLVSSKFTDNKQIPARLLPSGYRVLHFLTYNVYSEFVADATSDEFIANNKFVGENPKIPLSALPFRMYEFCCNYYFRNDQNNPYILNGEAQYNQFIPTTDGGWDTNEYLIHHRNWEMDAYTSAVPSPQYGTAPLVGLTYSGGDTATVQVDVTDSDGQSRKLGIQVGVDADGTINSVLHADEGVPSGSLRRLMDGTDGIQLGMSINDFRNVNAFQRFKENVLRRGLRYRNQLLSHMGVSVDYPDIDIPQFIGGFSGDLVVREVTNMSESADVALGDVAGKIDASLSSNHSITCYCPEHGFIMGIFSIVPVPTYSQLLPRMFTRYNYLDYFQQEFSKIGYVPITHREFLPLQSSNPDTVLGYQRAFYEYMFSTDEVHGDFRTTLADFVLYRQFKEVPTLNEDFVTVKSDSLNNIFAVDKVQEKYKNSAKFMCSFFFDVSHKMQIPKFGTPSLE